VHERGARPEPLQIAFVLWQTQSIAACELRTRGDVQMAVIFISHSSQDRAAAIRLMQWIKSNDFVPTFLDMDQDVRSTMSSAAPKS
jgi:hypothetical protein